MGGPVVLPKLYNGHDKTFFFADFERQPYRSPGTANRGLIPTPAEVSGNFLGGPPIYDPTTGQPFANNAIPSRPDQSGGRRKSRLPSRRLTSADQEATTTFITARWTTMTTASPCASITGYPPRIRSSAATNTSIKASRRWASSPERFSPAT